VRLLLELPWFESGDGEQLAVVLLDPAAYPPSDDVRPRVTHWGADPAFDAPALAGAPSPAAFPAGLPAVDGQINGVGAVVLVPHAVSFDADRGVCICDIPIDPGDAYAPFVRLAVVRYQLNSLPGLETSHTVQVPFVQVLPERRVTLTLPAPGAPDTFTVRVEGVTYSSSGAKRPPDPSNLGDATHIVTDIEGIDPVPPLVEVIVQERLAGTSDEAGWVPTLDPAVTVTADSTVSGADLQGAPPGTPLWTGRVVLPASRRPGQFRILVTEHELLDSDAVKEYSFKIEAAPEDVPPDDSPVHILGQGRRRSRGQRRRRSRSQRRSRRHCHRRSRHRPVHERLPIPRCQRSRIIAVSSCLCHAGGAGEGSLSAAVFQ